VKTKESSTAQKADLDPSGWDFRKEKVPTAEIEMCFIYEHARELAGRSKRIENLLATWRSGRNASRTSQQYRKASQAYFDVVFLLDECFDTSVLVDGQFPRLAWQHLDQEQKSTIAEGIDSGRPNIPDAPLAIRLVAGTNDAAMQFRAFRAFQGVFRDDVDRMRYGFVAIDWDQSIGAITRTFEEWLLSQKSSMGANPGTTKNTIKRREGGFRDQLNRLSALRLLQHYGSRGLLKDPQNPKSGIKFTDAPYGYLSDLYEAKAKAQKLVNVFLSIIDRS